MEYEVGDQVVFIGTYEHYDKAYNDEHFVVGGVYTVKDHWGDTIAVHEGGILRPQEVQLFSGVQKTKEDCM